MDAVEFFKTVNRLCKNNKSCAECPLCKKNMIKEMCMVRHTVMLGDASVESIEEMISKVEQWAKDHPVKTRQSEFLKMFPDADLCRDVIDISPCSIEKEMRKCCGDRNCGECKRTYWLEEVTDNGNVY